MSELRASRAAIVLLLIPASLYLARAEAPPNNEVVAKRVVIVDDAGDRIMELGQDDDNGVSLRIFDKEGRAMVVLSSSPGLQFNSDCGWTSPSGKWRSGFCLVTSLEGGRLLLKHGRRSSELTYEGLR